MLLNSIGTKLMLALLRSTLEFLVIQGKTSDTNLEDLMDTDFEQSISCEYYS